MITYINSILSQCITLFSNISISGVSYTFAIAWFFAICYFVGKIKK